MGPLTSAVHWWEESQMRVLVLSSLVIQFSLLIFTILRRMAIPGWIRFLMWLAYLGGDAIAIYALATLFNRHKDQDRGGNNMLEVFWAPILLTHLGGHDGITAYNIEDNELWSRHLLTAVSQVTVAIYVFWKSWPPGGGDKRLLAASVLLFVPGVLKCFTKPWALKRASINSLVSSSDAKRTAKKGRAGEINPNSLEKYVKQAKAFVQEQKNKGNEAQSGRACMENSDHPSPQQGRKQDKNDPFEEYVKREHGFVVREQKETRGRKERREQILRGEAYKLFVDFSTPCPGRRLSVFKYFWVISQEKQDRAEVTAYGYVRRGLGSAFLLLYTKFKTAFTFADRDSGFEVDETRIGFFWLGCIYVARLYLPWAAIGLFHKSHREAYNDTDAKITYAILCCTVVLDACSYVPVLLADMNVFIFGRPHIIMREQWPEMVAQYSLVRYFARNKNHGKLMWIASKLGCRDLVDRNWCMKPYLSSRAITELVLGYLRDGWEKKIEDSVASYCSFIDNRGHWALEGNGHLSWSIKEPFDESVLLWHIATDFCFFSSPSSEHIRVCDFAKVPSLWQILSEHLMLVVPAKTSESKKCGQRPADCKAVLCRQMSNYMAYLLFVNPEMLLPGTRRNHFRAAYHELKYILRYKNLNPQSCCCCCKQVVEKEIMKTLIDTMWGKSKEQHPEIGSKLKSKQGQSNGGCNGNFIDDAWDLAQGLLKLRDDYGEDKMWEVIQGVWVEMLCFSASRCRGYLHAKALGSGGEFLSYVWLLLFYMGMETFSERMQREREEHPIREGNNNSTSAPRASDAHNGNATTSSPSQIRNRGASSPSHVHTGSSTSNSEIHTVDID